MSVKFFCLLLLAGLVIISGCGDTEAEPVTTLTGLDKVAVGDSASREIALARCRESYNQNFALGTDFDDRPCLAEEITAGWACAVATETSPDIVTNLCPAYQNGTVEHIIVLDKYGQLLSAE